MDHFLIQSKSEFFVDKLVLFVHNLLHDQDEKYHFCQSHEEYTLLSLFEIELISLISILFEHDRYSNKIMESYIVHTYKFLVVEKIV